MIPVYPARKLAIGIPSRTVTYFSDPARMQRKCSNAVGGTWPPATGHITDSAEYDELVRLANLRPAQGPGRQA